MTSAPGRYTLLHNKNDQFLIKISSTEALTRRSHLLASVFLTSTEKAFNENQLPGTFSLFMGT